MFQRKLKQQIVWFYCNVTARLRVQILFHQRTGRVVIREKIRSIIYFNCGSLWFVLSPPFGGIVNWRQSKNLFLL